MTIVSKQQTTPVTTYLDEHILVVAREDIFSLEPAWAGLKQVDFKQYLTIINTKKEFKPRSLMEQDPFYKQIIPYLIFTHDNKYFLMQRTSTATEQRLQNKYSLGIGGHIRQEDLTTNSIVDWAQREFDEEVSYSGTCTFEPLGLLNDDSNDVGQVHLGFVFLVHGTHANITVRSELKSGILMSLKEMESQLPAMEPWSKIVYDFLCKEYIG